MNIGDHVRIGNGDIAWTIERFYTSTTGEVTAFLRSGNSNRTKTEPIAYLSHWRRSDATTVSDN